MQIRIWGARGSTPSPLLSDEIQDKLFKAIHQMPPLDSSDADAVRAYIDSLPPLLAGTAGGNTTCIEISTADETIIIDAGTGIQELGRALMAGPCGRGEGRIHLIFSHAHWDHIQGFPFFVPAFVPGNHITIYSVHEIESVLRRQQEFHTFPVSYDREQAEEEAQRYESPSSNPLIRPIPYMQARRDYVHVEPGKEFQIGPIRVYPALNIHDGDSYAYRFEEGNRVFVSASDAEYPDNDDDSLRARIEFFKDADVLLFDAQYGLRDTWESKEGYGHSSAMIGVDLARRARVKRLLLSHHDPTHSDAMLSEILSTAIAYHEQEPNPARLQIETAYEGLTIELMDDGPFETVQQDANGSRVLRSGDAFDEASVRYLHGQMDRLAREDGATALVIDLAPVERMTTTGLKTLLDYDRRLGRERLVLAAPNESTVEVIRLSGFGDYFAIYPSVEEAIRAVQARETLGLQGYQLDGRYQIVEVERTTTAASILRAVDMKTQQDVRLTVLSPSFEPETVARFVRQADRLVNLDHARINQTFACDSVENEAHTIVVEAYRPEPTLADLLDDGSAPISVANGLAIAQELVDVLAYVHGCGTVHGNLKPSDIHMADSGMIVTGFGFGQLESGRDLRQAPWLFLPALYLAPEQITGQPLDARTDLYALGVTLYQLFTGYAPFEGDERALLHAHLEQEPVPPGQLNPLLSGSIDHLIRKLLAKNPSNRYASASQVQQLLATMNPGEHSAQPPEFPES